jgi:hypothetical protein
VVIKQAKVILKENAVSGVHCLEGLYAILDGENKAYEEPLDARRRGRETDYRLYFVFFKKLKDC